MKKTFSWAISAVAAVGMVSALALAAETKGPVTDELGVVEIPKDAPIVIGGYWVISGPDTALGLDSQRGAEIAFDVLNALNEDSPNRVGFHESDYGRVYGLVQPRTMRVGVKVAF